MRLFLALLGVVYLAAFLSYGFQADGLVGRAGIAPAADLLERAWAALGSGAYTRLPTLLWLVPSSDSIGSVDSIGWGLDALCAGGAALIGFTVLGPPLLAWLA